MLSQLALVNDYFDHPHAVLYEDELIQHFGPDAIAQAILSGLLRHKSVPCGNQARRSVCWLNKY